MPEERLALRTPEDIRLSYYGCLWLLQPARQHTSAYVSIRQHTSAYVSIRTKTSVSATTDASGCSELHIQHTSAYVSVPPKTSVSATTDASGCSALQRLLCQYLCFCTKKSVAGATAGSSCSQTPMLSRLLRQKVYFCSSKASKVAATAGSSCSETPMLSRLLRQ
jgi:hypothetical protein